MMASSGNTLYVFCVISVISSTVYDRCAAERSLPPRIIKQAPSDEILFQVATRQDENDKPFIIECEAEGDPPPVYEWIKNGESFSWQTYDDRISQQPDRGSLVFIKPRDEDVGQYQCFAKNKWGTATSNSVFVRKAELNSFKEEPLLSVSVKEGEPYKFTCHAPDGWPKPSVHWLTQTSNGAIRNINSSRITLDPEGNLWFANVTRQDASDDFTYACAAVSGFRNEYKIGPRISLHVEPTDLAPDQNKRSPNLQYVSRAQEVALRDKNMQLFCIFGGTPLPQTVWLKNGKPLQVTDRIQQPANFAKSLLIKQATYEDEGNYTCEVSNGVGDAKSHSINLTVVSVPYFVEMPDFVNATEGETAVIRCKASGVPEPQIQWIYNGKHVASAASNSRRTVTTNTITIEKVEKSDIGNYGCNATNSLGYVYKDVYVNVLTAELEIIEAPRDEETVIGGNVTLRCRVSGVPKPEIKWIRNGIELTGARYTIQKEGDLQINEVGFTDMAQYTCTARNKGGERSASGDLTVRHRTEIKSNLGSADQEVKSGSPATFHCSAQKDYSLDLSISWLRNGQPIDFESESRFVMLNDYSLTITKTIKLDSGIYTCVASTRLDEATAQATLIVQDVPNAPKLVQVICNRKDASVNWQPMGDNRAPILTYTIQYNTGFTGDIWTNAFDGVPAAETSYNVPMSPWTNYTFRVVAVNKIGPSLPSAHSNVCKTEPDFPFKNPENVEARGTRPDNLVITWTPMPEIEHNAPRFHYRVSWKRDIPGSNWLSENISDWRTSRAEVSNQPTFQPYIVKVTAVNELGEATRTAEEIRGYSGEDAPTESPTNLTLLKVLSATSARIGWFPVRADSIRGHFRGYKIQAWSESDAEKIIRVTNAGNVTEADINILRPYSKNYVRVLAFNDGYSGPTSEYVTIETPEGLPDAVQSLTATPLGNSGFYLSWKPPLQPNGELTGYRIYYRPLMRREWGPLLERKPQITDPHQTKAKLSNLQSETKYRICINATTRAGEGASYWIEQYTGSPVIGPPKPPTFEWSRVSSDDILPTVRIDWIPDEQNAGSHFYIKYRIKGDTMFETINGDPDEHFVLVRDLKPDKTYEFVAVSVDGSYATESEVQEVEIVNI